MRVGYKQGYLVWFNDSSVKSDSDDDQELIYKAIYNFKQGYMKEDFFLYFLYPRNIYILPYALLLDVKLNC